AVNFIPSRLTLDLAGAPLTASYTNHGPMGHFGLFFIGAGDELFLSTAGAGQPFAGFEVAELAAHLQHVVSAMAADPDRRLSSIELIADPGRSDLAVLGNHRVLDTPPPDQVAITDMFAARVADAREPPAVRGNGLRMTDRELDAAGSRVAHLRVSGGVGPGDRVALVADRSSRAVIGILAVLKARAAYLPVGPAVPAARLEFILRDAAPAAALTTADLRSRLDGQVGEVIDLDDSAITEQPATALPGPAYDDTAYVIYTSGTTGNPKGVAATHHNRSEEHTSEL